MSKSTYSPLQFLGTCIFSASLFSLAAALIYFGLALSKTMQDLPTAADSVSELSESITPIVTLIPEILDESAAIRLQTREVVSETQRIVDALPAILEESQYLREESAAIRSEVEKVRIAIPPVLEEMAAYRELTPTVLNESEAIRNTISPALDRAEIMVGELKETADTAGENVVSNFFTGIFKAPLNLMSGISDVAIKSSKRVSKQDQAAIEAKLQEFINTAKVRDITHFSTSDQHIRGSVELLADHVEENKLCRKILFKSQEADKDLPSKVIDACRDNAGNWSITHN